MGGDFAFDRREYERWMGQAEHTIDAAKSDLHSQFYSWACFKCQQAAEYGIKALLRGVGLASSGSFPFEALERNERGREPHSGRGRGRGSYVRSILYPHEVC
jgi:HEPN domain-containing protein